MKRLNIIIFMLISGCSQDNEIKENSCLEKLQNSNHCTILKSRIKHSDNFDREIFILNSQYEFECIRPCKSI